MKEQQFDQQLDHYLQRAARRPGRKSLPEILGYTAAAGGLAFAGGDAIGAVVHVSSSVNVGWDASTATTNFNTQGWDIDNNGVDNAILMAGADSNELFAGVFQNSGAYVPVSSGAAYFAKFDSVGVQALMPGATVNGSLYFNGGAYDSFAVFGAQSFSLGFFGSFNNTTGYAGMVFGDANNMGPHFGWAKLRVDVDITGGGGAPFVNLTIFEYAYEDCTGVSIQVGQTTGGCDAGGEPGPEGSAPSPSTPLLALLGLGAMGVQTFRKRRDEGLRRLAENQA